MAEALSARPSSPYRTKESSYATGRLQSALGRHGRNSWEKLFDGASYRTMCPVDGREMFVECDEDDSRRLRFDFTCGCNEATLMRTLKLTRDDLYPWEKSDRPSTVSSGAMTVDAELALARDGATFILDEATELDARWGFKSEVAWARGESLMIVGPPGVGKTTLANQLVAALIGIRPTLLGYPVFPAARVLYLAMDRPRQIRRSMARSFKAEHGDVLRERLVVRPGPLPTDLAKAPEQLAQLAVLHRCDVIVIDSLKDAAIKLSDDETGGNVNRAIQICNVNDIDVLVLHHQRKGQNGEKPTTLEAVFGSTWLTAGTGSVMLLWGEAGSEQVELTHLKQPADPIGPLMLEHDHHAGTTVVTRGFDALTFLRNRGDVGATLAEAAQADHASPQKPGSAKAKKTERRLRSLVRDGLARVDEQGRSAGQFGEVRYYAVDVLRDASDV